MKSRPLKLGMVFVLVAAMAVPAAVLADDTTDVTGEIRGAEITVTAPDEIDLEVLQWGENPGQSEGSVTVAANSWGPGDLEFTLTAIDEGITDPKDGTAGHMRFYDDVGNEWVKLSTKLLISPDDDDWKEADLMIRWDWSGESPGTYPFTLHVNQWIDTVEQPGDYEITITFTASLTTLP